MLLSLSHALSRWTRFMFENMRPILLLSLLVGLWLGVGLTLLVSLILTFTVYLLTGGHRFMRQVYYTLPRDAKALYVLLSLKFKMKQMQRANQGIPSIFSEVCNKNRQKTCLIDAIEDKQWSFEQVEDYSNQIANYFLGEGVKNGETVGVFMESSAQYVCMLLGLSKTGAIPALLNYNLRGLSLAHCLEAADVTRVIYSSELCSAIDESREYVKQGVMYYCVGPITRPQHDKSIDDVISSVSSSKPPVVKYDFNSPLIYIYTSGTTGLPKAAKVVHSRYYYMACSISSFMGLDSSSVIYDTLPLYHTAGGILGVGQALLKGSTVVIRKKFSASNYWADCIKYNCTAAQYIGEICRYLLAQPAKLEDQQHKVKTVFGNGLRPQIWLEFKNRFGIERIGEFYGATEGNASAINIDNTVGCVGFTSVIAPSIHPISLIVVDKNTGSPIRASNGLCIRATPGEQGELIGKIVNSDPLKRFDGYATKAATEKKIAHDVFTYGDKYFLTGDILAMDEFGYLYFKDRTGDTFRWKGENVSSAEVEAIVSNTVDKRDAVVYGVEIPGLEGRAGMVAIEDPDGEVNLTSLYRSLSHSLPAYARPIFVRLLKQAEKTATFKLMKVDLRDEGYNPTKINDSLYYLDCKLQQYVQLTPDVYQNIVNGDVRF